MGFSEKALDFRGCDYSCRLCQEEEHAENKL